MSIILDALKKSQSEKSKPDQDKTAEPTQGSHTGMFKPSARDIVEGFNESGTSNKVRVILLGLTALAIILAVSLFALGPKITSVFTRASVPQHQPKPLTQPLTLQGLLTPKSPEEVKQGKIAAIRKKAEQLFQQENYTESVAVYKEIVELLPSDAEAYNNYGVALKKAGKDKEAEDAYNTALALNPDYAEALNNLAVVELANRNYNSACRKLRKAIEIKPDYLDPHLHLALCLEKIGDLTGSKQYYEAFLRMSEGKANRKLRLQIENRLSRLNEEEY